MFSYSPWVAVFYYLGRKSFIENLKGYYSPVDLLINNCQNRALLLLYLTEISERHYLQLRLD